MLRITDARTGETVDAVRARRGLTRVEAHVERDDLSALRVLLVADVLARALELGGTPVVTVADPPAGLRARADALGIRRAEGERGGAGPALHVLVSAGGAPEDPGPEDPGPEGSGPAGSGPAAFGPAASGETVPGEAAGGETTAMDATTMDATSMGAASMAPASMGQAPTDPVPVDQNSVDQNSVDEDPVIPGLFTADPDGVRVEVAPVRGSADHSLLRMILLATPRRQPLDLAAADLDGASETLGRWRKAVAGWATRPSRPVPEHVRQELRAAWEDDLDVPAVLEALRRVEHAGDIPDGARFETYAYADRLLGLELTRDIGTQW
ncbi:cysteine--tRNA ligase [Streptomyces fagopyri]|uniref:hypothetical protein n=1 Tax=Streptomyces fagopyri TaxID=2662397 RepID=UPI001885A76F|nr:hypothetical protein [Streptomyces fagopyri]